MTYDENTFNGTCGASSGCIWIFLFKCIVVNFTFRSTFWWQIILVGFYLVPCLIVVLSSNFFNMFPCHGQYHQASYRHLFILHFHIAHLTHIPKSHARFKTHTMCTWSHYNKITQSSLVPCLCYLTNFIVVTSHA